MKLFCSGGTLVDALHGMSCICVRT